MFYQSFRWMDQSIGIKFLYPLLMDEILDVKVKIIKLNSISKNIIYMIKIALIIKSY
jgi:hypothetical protein